MRFLSCKPGNSAPPVARTKLVPAVKSLISVLTEVEQYPALYLNQRVLREAIRRYEHIWIPLLANTPPSQRLALVPPLDVEWVWFCHMLCPVKYVVDSAAIWRVSRPEEPDFLLDHKLLSWKARCHGKKKAKLAWEQRFPNEPFDVMTSIRDSSMQEDQVSDKGGNDLATPKSNISYDIALAAGRQMAFYYQVAIMPQYNDDKFLRDAVKRYRNKYLTLQRKFPSEIWVPTFDIDVAWHTHMLHPRWYKKETSALRGSILPHDDTLNDRSLDSATTKRWNATRERWLEVFGESVTRDGGNWRGNVEGSERALRQTVTDVVKDVESQLKASGGTLFSLWDEDSGRYENLGGTDWVHMTDRRRANHHGVGTSDRDRVVERYTFLAPSGERASLLMSRTSHFLMCDAKGNPYSFCTTVEIFDSKPHEHSKQPRYPIATAHHTLPETICVGTAMENKICSLVPGETALVLRMRGEDFALLCGRWRAFWPPRKGVPALNPEDPRIGENPQSGDPGDPGELSLRIWLLGENSCGKWIPLLRKGSRLEPGSFSFQLPYRDENGVITEDLVCFNLSDATVRANSVTNIIPGYLICMASAVLHVALQPRFEPHGGASLPCFETMYPAWSVCQKNYASLRGAGGEVSSDGQNVGLSAMRLSMVLEHKRPNNFFAARVDDIGEDQNITAVR